MDEVMEAADYYSLAFLEKVEELMHFENNGGAET